MGGKAKKNNHFLKEVFHQRGTSNCSASARNLCKKDLGGVILGCTHHTIEECYSKKLFGLPRPHYAYIKKIEPGLPLFLFNYGDRKLHGVFEAISRGQMNIDIRAWTKESFEETPYPAQVKARTRIDCRPLLEEQFQPVIISNYHRATHFWFELDQEQTTKLICLFSSNRIDATFPREKYPDRRITLEKDLLAFNSRIGGERTETPPTGWDLAQPNQVIGDWRSNESPRSEKERLLLGSDNNEFAAPEHEKADQSRSYANANKFPQKLWSALFRSDSTSDAREQPQSSKSVATEAKGFDDLTGEETKDIAGFAAEAGVIASGQCNPEGSVPAEVCINASTRPLSPESRKEFEEHASSEPSHEAAQEAWIHLRGASSTFHATSEYDEFKVVDPETRFSPFDYKSMVGDASVVAPNFNGESHLSQPHIDKERDEEALSIEKKSMGLYRRSTSSSISSQLSSFTLAVTETQGPIPYEPTSSYGSSSTMITTEIARENLEEGADVLSHDVGVSEIVAELLCEVRGLMLSQLEQAQRFGFIEKELRQKICCLEDRCKALELRESSTVGPVGETQYETGCEPRPFNKSIFIVGGYDGSSYLSASYLYSPHEDILTSLSPMRFVRSQASVAKLRGELYVCGGVYDGIWHDTVESYSQEYDKWTDRPSMNRQRGSLVGVSLKDKIFAIGGAAECVPFSDVEMYDPDTGRWIPTGSMLCKRLAPAAAELNGILYAVGGYNGEDYLESAERFDPRECSWRPIKDMSTKRGGHSLVVLNEKLYAVGGYDGSRMVATVEVFDPRADSWMMVESMNEAKTNHGAVVIEDVIYSLGGLDEDMEVLDTVECYKEGLGWREIDLKAFGKRCCFSAIVV
ncbi:uncharacterized protein LOC115673031 [Syzygium oleosum]|uniref:uncharacterized protein LOC115673031 n=1 Tax=Syzygium oleosum TaxID=219896 RepID=UPI0024B92011|nr:uncharacterized protein LOC115673031 [Syzygium oleosum]XP_056164839.1 uncharacterized protein LOC115673031 [Syzygium oleosum]